ncbi:MAG: hypothetical protein GYA55_11820 [SAR324 cluster bacterium]|uniref:Uncharacterized protein n=1 Tax=SAR324 cluster bacterium TaxID=2024889 RepID=A0A7X9FTH5_9DELT|nr:hypothetical protein [SAR324 cluster bacterium]
MKQSKANVPYNFLLSVLIALSLLALKIEVALGSDLTLEMRGPGAAIGRLLIMSDQSGDLTPLNLNCPFQLDTDNPNFSPLNPEQLSCTYSALPEGSHVYVLALRQAFWSQEPNTFWLVGFNSFSGICSGGGNSKLNEYQSLPVAACEFYVGRSNGTLLQVSFDTLQGGPAPTPTSTPSPTPTPTATSTPDTLEQITQFMDESVEIARKSLTNLGMAKLLKKGSVRIKFPPSPENGTLRLRLTTRIKLPKKRSLVRIDGAFSNILLAVGKVALSQSVEKTMKFSTTKQGQQYMSNKNRVSATLQASWKPTGSSTASAIESINMLLRRR